MNQNGTEERIQQLFREMSDGDRMRTPAFSRVVQGASSSASPFRIGVSRRLAFTLAMLCLVMTALAVVTLRRQRPANQIAEVTQPADERRTLSDLVARDRHPEVVLPPIPGKAVSAVMLKRVRHHKSVNDLALAMKLSSWKSPTALLLKTNEDAGLMSLPKLGESLKTIRSYSLDELN